MDDDQNDAANQEGGEDASAEVMDIDETAKSVGLRSGDSEANTPHELNTNQDLKEDEKSEWES